MLARAWIPIGLLTSTSTALVPAVVMLPLVCSYAQLQPQMRMCICSVSLYGDRLNGFEGVSECIRTDFVQV